MDIDNTTLVPILDKASDIAKCIAGSEEARSYWQAREKMSRNKDAQALFDSLKKKTNGMLVLKERLGEGNEKFERVQMETQEIEERLSEIPVALQYKSAQDELNAMLQEVMLVLLHRLGESVPVEAGPRECGSGGCTSCSAH